MPDKPNQPSRRSQRESDSGAAGAGGPGGGEPAQPEQPGAAQPSGAEMAQPADAGPVQPGNAGPVQPANVGPVQPANAGPTQPTGDLEVQSAPVRPYMIGRKSGPLPADVIPVDLNLLEAKFKEEQIPGARLKKTVTRPGALGLFDLGGGPSDKIIVAEMPEAHAKALAQSPDLIVEEDRPIQLPQTPVSAPAPPQTRRDPGLVFPQGLGFTVTISVVGTDGAKIPGAEVHVFGVWDHPGITDANGQIQLPLYGETGNSITALYVKPHADYWDILISQPPLDSARNNIVAVAPLSTSFPNFPNQEVTGWGLKAMKIDQLPASFRGRGIKVGLVDSGIALNHRDLQQLVKSGYDTTQTDNPNGWSNDEIGHGTHCAGVIAGRINQLGIRGIAPDVDLYVYKIFPGGSFSNLIDALNHCLADGVDIVNLSLGDRKSVV